ncbi:MAG TPA: ABC transporter permease [Acidimicrobiales bacterium]|nr:ABC transporter permease [Acidimicrobiales bacterium]
MLTSRSLRRGGVILGALVGVIVLCDLMSLVWSHKLIPTSVIALAAVNGCGDALIALGIVLVYRATRILNFSQAAFGTVGSVMFFELLTYMKIPYGLALPAGILSSAVIGLVLEFLIMRRFRAAPRLVATVVTISLAGILDVIATQIPGLLGDHQSRATTVKTPLSAWHKVWFPVVFTGNHLAFVGATLVVLAGFVMFLRRSPIGIAIRGASENQDRAALLGVNTTRLITLVWVIAAALSGLATTLQVPINGFSVASVGTSDVTLLLVGFAAAVMAGMDNLPVTVAAALGIDIFSQSVFYISSQTAISDVAVLLVILVAFLLQRRKLVRTDEADASSWANTEEVRPIPKELAGLPSVRSGTRWVMAIIGIIVLAFPFVMSPSQTQQGSMYLIFGIVVVSLVVLTGWGGQISLGQFAFVAVGALVGGSLTYKAHVPFLIAVLVGALLGGVTAIILGLTSLRVRGLYLAITTLAFANVTTSVILNQRFTGAIQPSSVNRPKLPFMSFENERSFYYLCLAALILAIFAAVGLRRSRTGRVLIAMRDNERAAQVFGINLVRTRLATFALSGGLAAAAGVFFAAHEHAVNSQSFAPTQSINMFLIAIIGGLGSVQGALLGVLYFALVSILVPAPWGPLFAGPLGTLLVLLFLPGGLGSGAYKIRDSFLRRVAIRRRIYVPSLLAAFGLAAGQTTQAPLSPLVRSDGGPATVPARYRVNSRIGESGASQAARGWRI